MKYLYAAGMFGLSRGGVSGGGGDTGTPCYTRRRLLTAPTTATTAVDSLAAPGWLRPPRNQASSSSVGSAGSVAPPAGGAGRVSAVSPRFRYTLAYCLSGETFAFVLVPASPGHLLTDCPWPEGRVVRGCWGSRLLLRWGCPGWTAL